MTAETIIDLLRAKHADAIFVTECKNGPTQGIGGHARLDAWVMPKSWSNPAIIGYEVKVSRSDFINDNKWRGYLFCCNQFYFAAAPGIIDPKELPPEAGLLEVSKTGTRLFLKKKTIHRDFTTAEELQSILTVFRYVLMCRAKITREFISEQRAIKWEQELAKQADDRRYGHLLGRRIGKIYQEEVSAIQAKNIELERQMQNYDAHRAFLKRIGLDPESAYTGDWAFERRWKEIQRGCGQGFVSDLKRAAEKLTAIAKDLESDQPPS